jgi:serine phosphatase RsbU (regulator of sigma subunit)
MIYLDYEAISGHASGTLEVVMGTPGPTIPRLAALTPTSRVYSLPWQEVVEQLLQSHPSWRIRDARGHWVCPYCAMPSEIVLEQGKPSTETVRAIAIAASACEAYDERRPLCTLPLAQVQLGVALSESIMELEPRLHYLLRQVAVWQVVDPQGRWRCPYCVEAVSDVPLLEGQGPSPRHVARHLLSSCSAYAAGAEPAATTVELWERSGLADPRKLRKMRRTEAHLDYRYRQLKQAGRCQRSMLPALPNRSGVDFAAHFEAGGYLGTSFYDFHELRDGRLGIVVGEIRGEGINAAFVVAMSKKVLSITAQAHDDPIEILAASNEELFSDLGGSTEIALLYLTLDPQGRRMTFVRAGGEAPWLYRPGLARAELAFPSTFGIPIGAVRGSLFRHSISPTTLPLEAGDLVLICTSGLIEAHATSGEAFGRERLGEALMELGQQGPSTLVNAIGDRWTRYLEGTSTKPDQLFVSFAIAAQPPGSTPERPRTANSSAGVVEPTSVRL